MIQCIVRVNPANLYYIYYDDFGFEVVGEDDLHEHEKEFLETAFVVQLGEMQEFHGFMYTVHMLPVYNR